MGEPQEALSSLETAKDISFNHLLEEQSRTSTFSFPIGQTLKTTGCGLLDYNDDFNFNKNYKYLRAS